MSKKQNKKPDWIPATLSEYDGVRFLHLDSIWVQGAMRIRKPQQLELEYVQRMMAWLLWRDTAALREGHVAQLGLGAAALTRFSHKVLRMPHTTAVEINPTVIAACRSWFHLPEDDARLSVVNADAGAWIADPQRLQSLAVLNVDLYDHDAASPVLDDEAFYAACRGALEEGGLMTVNLFGRAASFARSATRIARVFGSDQVWSLAPTKEGNTIVVAARGVAVPEREELERRAANIESQYQLPARKWLRLVRPLPMSIINQLHSESQT
ncbi:spermidine synthase [Roseateles sp. DAIF2]|uniref:spermine/spermidine synthase domain-containing protein n=1 Tax=Roseateles sp. DAIF2 TaxID=2714952 RepID=UPI0018A24ECD|nr:spermidine synthase [Roseateles sp. DAIF2]QPF73014.1 spermidine synthase [Roseateles sp. DAIF2]